MTQVVDPESGLAFVELSHPWGMYTPILPGYEEIKFERITYHAKFGVMTHKFITIFHTSTHVNAPIHLIPGAPRSATSRSRPSSAPAWCCRSPRASGSWSSRRIWKRRSRRSARATSS